MELSPGLLLSAYAQGIFPMADPGGEIYWYDPDPRAILPLDRLHVPRRLERTIQQGRFQVRHDVDFERVMRECAAPAPGRERTWIDETLVEGYTALHRAGFAHSVETWQDGELVGGVYGVSLRGLFAGESMFSRVRDASKVALVHLARTLRERGFTLFDVQFRTDHLQRFGVVEVPRREYKRLLRIALGRDVAF